jgi:hypothetical protein
VLKGETESKQSYESNPLPRLNKMFLFNYIVKKIHNDLNKKGFLKGKKTMKLNS